MSTPVSRPTVGLVLLGLVLATAASAQTFTVAPNFPTPASGAYGVTGVALPDGAALVWDGLNVYRQVAPKLDRYAVVATGYAGDPGFAALSPDGSTVLLGQGYGGNLYRFDLASPADYTADTVVGTASHFSGAYLTDTLVILDAGTPDYQSELIVLDISGAKHGAGPALVVAKTGKYANTNKEAVLPKPGYSTSIYVDRTNGLVYAMDGQSRELRSFGLQALVDAYNTLTPLDWAADGTLVGQAGDFFGGGVDGINAAGNLVISGSEGFGQPGGVQIVDPRLDDPSQAAVLQTLDPTGTQGYVKALFNGATQAITAIDYLSVAYIQPGGLADAATLANFPSSPAVGSYGVVADFASDGRIVAWDGNSLYVQQGVGADAFDAVETSIPGDPAFIKVAPSGTRVVLGAGGFGAVLYLGDIYEYEMASKALPVAVNTDNNFWADFASDDILLVNRLMPGLDTSEGELVAVDLSAATPAVTPVLQHIPPYSAAFTVDIGAGVVYVAHSEFGVGGLVRSFALADVLAGGMDWSEGLYVGAFDNGGPSDVTGSGLLTVGGFAAMFQTVDPVTGVVVSQENPAGLGFGGYTAAYSSALDLILAVSNDFAGNFGLWLMAPPLLGAGDGCQILCLDDAADTDGDTLPDCAECTLGTNRFLADTDGDGVDDATEVGQGTDPLNPNESQVMPVAGAFGLALLLIALAGLATRRMRA